jgi:uncharacterized protein
VKFWDASALVPLLVEEEATDLALSLAGQDPAMLVWWGSQIECVSALARLEREGALDREHADRALGRLAALGRAWHEIEPSELVRESAIRFLRVHALRAADAQQLAAAFVAAERRPPSLEMVTFDDRLAAVARREGFVLVDATAV